MQKENSSPRWKLRLKNYLQALTSLQGTLDYRQGQIFEPGKMQLEMERQACIKSFEYTYELGWKTLKDYLEEAGNSDLPGSKSVIRLAVKEGIIPEMDAQIWMDMVGDRNLTTHTYDLEIAARVVGRITKDYRAAFERLANHLKENAN